MMMRFYIPFVVMFVAAVQSVSAAPEQEKTVQGITVFGNRDGPKSMVVMPWRDATQAEMAGFRLENVLAEELQPIDPDVFQRKVELNEILWRGNSAEKK